MSDKNKCWNYCLKLLNYKALFEKELDLKLREKGYSPEEREDSISRLKSMGYINDLTQGAEFVRFQLRKGFGPQAIAFKLAQKAALSHAQIEALCEEAVSEEEQLELLKTLVNKKYKSLDHSDLKNKQKIYAYLARRGFSQSLILHFIDTSL